MRATLIAVLLLAGCGTLSPLELVSGEACASDEQCKGERICQAGRCLYPEEVSRDGGFSDGGSWDAGPADGGTSDGGPGDAGPFDGGGPAPGEVGAACEDHAECSDPGAFCFQEFPDGYCLVIGCIGGCPAGSICVGAGESFCLQSCEGDLDCRTGYLCSTAFGTPTCLPRQGGGTAPTGAACTEVGDCSGETAVCIAEWPEGYCTNVDCLVRGCEMGSTCYPTGNDGTSACLADCFVDADCGREDYVCQHYRSGAAGACVPHCAQADLCRGRQTCNPETGRCE